MWKYWLKTEGRSTIQITVDITVWNSSLIRLPWQQGLHTVSVEARTNKWLAVSGNVHINLAMNLSIITIYLLCLLLCLSCKISGRSLPMWMALILEQSLGKSYPGNQGWKHWEEGTQAKASGPFKSVRSTRLLCSESNGYSWHRKG